MFLRNIKNKEARCLALLFAVSTFVLVHCDNTEGLTPRTKTTTQQEVEETKRLRGEKRKLKDDKAFGGHGKSNSGKKDKGDKSDQDAELVLPKANTDRGFDFDFASSGQTTQKCVPSSGFCYASPCCDGLSCNKYFLVCESADRPLPPVAEIPNIEIPVINPDIMVPVPPVAAIPNKETPYTTEVTTPAPVPSPSAAPSDYTQAPVMAYFPAQSCRPLEEDIVMYWCPTVRYCEWGYYGPEVQNHLGQMGYTQFEWQYIILSSDVDATSFYDHTHSVRQNLKGLGYDEDKHDCCNGHYGDYWWQDFFDYEGYDETINAIGVLGYNETSWNEGWVMEYDDFWWNELPQEVQWAVYDGLCYTEELWNEFPLTLWGDDVTLPASYLKSALEKGGGYYYDEFDGSM